jgi:hypothetical protein
MYSTISGKLAPQKSLRGLGHIFHCSIRSVPGSNFAYCLASCAKSQVQRVDTYYEGINTLAELSLPSYQQKGCLARSFFYVLVAACLSGCFSKPQ